MSGCSINPKPKTVALNKPSLVMFPVRVRIRSHFAFV